MRTVSVNLPTGRIFYSKWFVFTLRQSIKTSNFLLVASKIFGDKVNAITITKEKGYIGKDLYFRGYIRISRRSPLYEKLGRGTFKFLDIRESSFNNYSSLTLAKDFIVGRPLIPPSPKMFPYCLGLSKESLKVLGELRKPEVPITYLKELGLNLDEKLLHSP